MLKEGMGLKGSQPFAESEREGEEKMWERVGEKGWTLSESVECEWGFIAGQTIIRRSYPFQ